MLLTVLLLQTSLLARPLYLSEEPPELRSVQHVLLLHQEVESVHLRRGGTREKALAFAAELVERIRAGADFEAVAARNSMAHSSYTHAMLGTFAPGMLRGELDEFLFSADVGDVSAPIDDPSGVFILRRVETHAGALHILVRGKDEAARERCSAILAKLEQGADFGELAAEYSDEADTAENGGQYQIFERGPRDRLFKAAAFGARMGEVVGPFESSVGLHFIKRVPVDAIDPALMEKKVVRARAILVAFTGALGSHVHLQRDEHESKHLADELRKRIAEGEDMAKLAAEVNDDIDGKERAGDLGWIHRGSPDLPVFMERLFTMPVGWLSEPIVTSAGYAIVKRER